MPNSDDITLAAALDLIRGLEIEIAGLRDEINQQRIVLAKADAEVLAALRAESVYRAMMEVKNDDIR